VDSLIIFVLFHKVCYNTFMKDTVKYKSHKNIIYSCKYYIVWCSKYRRKVLVDDVEKKLKEVIVRVANEAMVEILNINTNKDCIHILCEVDPQFGVKRFIKLAKSRSAKILREEFIYLKTKLPTLWTNSYFISTVGDISPEAIKQYIANQEKSQRSKEKLKWQNYLKSIS